MPTARADSASTNANTAVKIAVLANDAGTGLTIVSVTAPANGTARINADKTITYTPKALYTGSDSFKYTIRDGAGKRATATVSLTVRNRRPVAGADAAVTDGETAVTILVLANDSDPDGHPLTVAGVTQPANGTAILNADQSIVYLPAADFTGEDGFAYTVRDGRGGSAQGTVTVTVRNRAPMALADAAVTDGGTPVDIAVLANDSDPDGDLLAVAAVTAPQHGTAGVNPDGSVRYTPQLGFTGTDGFSYTVDDGAGGTAEAEVTVTVRNRPPLAVDDAAATDAGIPVDLAVLANDDDPDGHPLGVTAVGPPAHGTATASPDGTIRYTPLPGFSGTDGFAYTVADGQGGSATAAVTVEVRNRPPVAGDDMGATDAGVPVDLAVLANDNDPDGHALGIAAIGLPAHGTTVANPDGTIRYTPEAGFTGADSFSYTLADGHGGSAQGVVTLTVRNRAPVAGADMAATDAYAAVTIDALANDGDPDGHGLQITSVTQPAHGTAAIVGGQILSYAPHPGFMGSDGFSYTVADGHGGSADGTVTITVRGWGEPFGDGTFFTDATGWRAVAA